MVSAGLGARRNLFGHFPGNYDLLPAAAAPAFYQTRWFYALLCLAASLVLWQLLRLRMSLLEKRLRGRLEEREAIARELHDTLLQSTQGLIYSFQSIISASRACVNGPGSWMRRL
jgi:hypothetical protein